MIARALGPYNDGEGASRVGEIEDEINVVASVIQGTLRQAASLIDGGIEDDLADADDEYSAELDGGRKPLIAQVRGQLAAKKACGEGLIRKSM